MDVRRVLSASMEDNPYEAPQELPEKTSRPKPIPFRSGEFAFVALAIYVGLPLLALVVTAVLAAVFR